jgi:hypothetical protein
LIGVHQFIGTVWIDPLYTHESPSSSDCRDGLTASRCQGTTL